MNTRQRFPRIAALALAAAWLAPLPASAQTSKAPLAVSTIKPTPSLTSAMAASGKSSSLNRVVDSLDSQLINSLNASRKFDIVGRSDLKSILKEQELAGSGNVNVNDANAAQAGKLAGAKYLLTATIDDFEDATERMEFANLNKVGLKRKIRISIIAKIYDSTSGKLLESANIVVNNKDDRMDAKDLQRNAEATDALLVDTTRDAAERIANRVADIIFPVKVLSKRDKQITVNRGEGAGMKVGQLWNVFVMGQELVDPDTKEVLGREEVLVGKARIVSVQPKLSTAAIVEDNGIDRGAVLRRASE